MFLNFVLKTAEIVKKTLENIFNIYRKQFKKNYLKHC